LIIEWRKAVGDAIAVGDVLCEVETDKATFEVESTEAGTLLTILHQEGEDVPVLANLCVVGAEGDDVSAFSSGTAAEAPAEEAPAAPAATEAAAPAPAAATPAPAATPAASGNGTATGISPRARQLAADKGVDASAIGGSGPGGRVIERDVQAALANGTATPAAIAAGAAPGTSGTGIGGRVTVADVGSTPAAAAAAPVADEVVVTPLKGIRKLISDRMLESLQTTAQLTLTRHANAETILGMRKRFKGADESFGLNKITVNDLMLYAVSRTLPKVPELNCLFQDNAVHAYKSVHLGFAVDTPRGLMVPVIRNADQLTLAQLSAEAKRLAIGCIEGGISPDELNGGTFTVSNLGAFGIEAFTPVLNPPQVGILGVGGSVLRPIKTADGITHQQQLSLSLTINHQVVDGAPAARFLQALAAALNDLDLILAQ
jgi:pyruvate dehydrogenase E2 component (dihydrolipoamide acetyltransferase)